MRSGSDRSLPHRVVVAHPDRRHRPVITGFAGTAPDLGAYERGAALSTYGPRGAPPADTTPPVISGPGVGAITDSGATVTWTTDEGADTQVDYGGTAGYGSATALATALTTGHSRTLAGLAPATTYHVRARSRDAAGNLALSADVAFTTAAASGSGGTGSGSAGTAGGGCGAGAAVAVLAMALLRSGLGRRVRS